MWGPLHQKNLHSYKTREWLRVLCWEVFHSFSKFLGVFLQKAAALLFVKENTAETLGAVKVVTIWKGFLFIQDTCTIALIWLCVSGWSRSSLQNHFLGAYLTTTIPHPPFFNKKRIFPIWIILLLILSMLWKVSYRAADAHTRLRIQLHVAEEVCKMQISITGNGRIIVNCTIEVACYLDSFTQSLLLFGMHQRKQLNTVRGYILCCRGSENRSEMLESHKIFGA